MRAPAAAIASRQNLFDLLRVASASAVLFSHAFSLTGRTEPVRTAIGFEAGTLGVLVLFALSGYLLAAGWEQPQSGGDYWLKRALRIMPGLLVTSVLTALALGPIVSRLGVSAYFTRAGPYVYIAKHAVLDTFSSRLPGVFTHNPYPAVVNGSLWTIPVEVCCYFALYLAHRFGALQRPRVTIAILGLVSVAMLVGHPPDDPNGLAQGTVQELLSALRPCGAFLSGVILWQLRDTVPRTASLLIAAIVLALVPLPSGLHSMLLITLLPYAVVIVGSMGPGRLRSLTARGDLTYGVYICSYPIQQTLAAKIAGLTPLGMLAISFPLSFAVALASWVLIERPALGLRRRLGLAKGSPAPERQAAAAPAIT